MMFLEVNASKTFENVAKECSIRHALMFAYKYITYPYKVTVCVCDEHMWQLCKRIYEITVGS